MKPVEMTMTTEEMQEDERLMREEVAREVFGGEKDDVDDLETDETVETTDDDPWAGVNPVLRQTLESLQSRLGDIDSINTRLKQAESRIGGAERRLHEARIAAEKVSDAPTAEQLDKASRSAEKMTLLKEEFPEWADVLEDTRNELTGKTAELERRIPDVEALRGSINEELESRVDAVRKEMAIEAVRAVHEDLDEIKTSPLFADWVNKQPPDITEKLGSWKPSDAIKVLNSYKDFVANKRPTKTIAAERQQRLESAAADNRKNGKPIKTKSLDDMTDEEYRAYVARQIFHKR
jgi:DNA repair exonuclease SbcCD ATPase subunit